MLCHPDDALLDSNATIKANNNDVVDEPFLMQPPSLVNTVHSPFYADDNEQTPTFLDSVCCALDNESNYNVHNRIACTNPPIPPPIVIPDYFLHTQL